MNNIILLVKDRPRLTEQTLRTLYMHTDKSAFNLTVVDDGSWPETTQILRRYEGYGNIEIVTFLHSVSIVGFLRNVGVWASERFFGRGDYLYHSDNDIAFTPRWLDIMTDRLDFVHSLNVCILGGYRHPFHGLRDGALTTALHEGEGVDLTDAVAGYSHLMKWSTWDQYGPYDQHAKGVCQSEDFAICQKIKADHGHVGYIHTPVIHNCGLTNSEGKPAIGAEHFPRIPGLVYE
jgi:hypothetical protein